MRDDRDGHRVRAGRVRSLPIVVDNMLGVGSARRAVPEMRRRERHLGSRARARHAAAMPQFRLQFDLACVPQLAANYDAAVDTEVERIAPSVRARGWFEHEELTVMCKWKSPRTQPRVASNSPELVREVTRIAHSATDERVRIGVLRILNGVSWPTASVLLHFGHRDRYPILDVRALEALGVKQPGAYTFEFWWAYVEVCRRLADRASVDMRTLDRALWQWSKGRARS